jgi:hypothetical protein
MSRMGIGMLGALGATFAVGAGAPAAGAAHEARVADLNSGYAQSVRWSGWIVQQRGAHFDRVSATWHVPSANCPPHGGASYSLTWIGLGGADENKLEQIGTETDCAPSAGSQHSVPYTMLWWEVLPAPEQYPNEQVNPGDLVNASVTIKGKVATIELQDETAGWKYVKRTKPRQLTESSADWIEEDPEICPGTVIYESCPEKPFAHFTKVTFSNALAGTTKGRTGPLTDSHWTAIKYGMLQGTAHLRLLSWPSPLDAGGTSFTISRTNSKPPPEPEPV